MKHDFFLDTFSKNTQMSIFMKNRPAVAELFHADGQTDMTEAISGFHLDGNEIFALFGYDVA
jgi:hypothetical protein